MLKPKIKKAKMFDNGLHLRVANQMKMSMI